MSKNSGSPLNPRPPKSPKVGRAVSFCAKNCDVDWVMGSWGDGGSVFFGSANSWLSHPRAALTSLKIPFYSEKSDCSPYPSISPSPHQANLSRTLKPPCPRLGGFKSILPQNWGLGALNLYSPKIGGWGALNLYSPKIRG